MNKHIELVKKWLNDKDSVSLEELEASKEAADDEADEATYCAYSANNNVAAANNAVNAADYAYYAVDNAYYAGVTANVTATADYTANAAYWVKRYEELTNE